MSIMSIKYDGKYYVLTKTISRHFKRALIICFGEHKHIDWIVQRTSQAMEFAVSYKLIITTEAQMFDVPKTIRKCFLVNASEASTMKEPTVQRELLDHFGASF